MKRIELTLAVFAFVSSVSAQPNIEHVGLECIAPGQFAVVLSGIDPKDEIQTAKTYFRSSLYPDFYYVEMKFEDGQFVGILPQPAPDTSQIVYYLEAVDGAFNGTRSPEFEPFIKDPCRDRPGAAHLPSGDPGIVVGATTAGQSALPPGFSAAGIVGTIAATGVSSGVGGGISTGVAVATAASAAGVAGAVVATSPASEPTTSVPAAAAVTSVTTTTTPPTGPATTTVPGQPTTTTSTPGPTTTTVGSGASTTTTVSGSTTTSSGPSTTTSVGAPTTTTTAASTTTTSAPSTTTTTASAALNAGCFTVQVLAPCKVRVDATCVALPVDQYEWTLDQNDNWQRADFPNGPASFDHTFGNCGSSQTLKFKLKVYRGGSNDVSVQDYFITGSSLKAPTDSSASIALDTHLALPPFDGSARGRILLAGAGSRTVDSSQPATLHIRAVAGENRIEAVVFQPGSGPGTWWFDFGQEPHLLRGSLRALEGNVLGTEPTAIVFRLSGNAEERLQFTFELDR